VPMCDYYRTSVNLCIDYTFPVMFSVRVAVIILLFVIQPFISVLVVISS